MNELIKRNDNGKLINKKSRGGSKEVMWAIMVLINIDLRQIMLMNEQLELSKEVG